MCVHSNEETAISRMDADHTQNKSALWHFLIGCICGRGLKYVNDTAARHVLTMQKVEMIN